MKLLFSRLIIENFLSIGSADIDLLNRGYTLVHGVNNNPKDLAKSNGSGKSSLFEALVWCLTGETVRGVKDVVNMFHEGGTCVELHFTVDKDSYVVTRYKDHAKYKTDLKIHVNGQDKSGKGIRDSQKLLESYLPDLTASLLGSVVVLGQGLPQRFTNNTPSGRKDVLEKLSKSDFMIDDLKERLTTRKQELNSKQREYEDAILVATSEIHTHESQIKTSESKLDSLEDPALYDDLILRANTHVQQLNESLNEYRDKLQEWKSKLETAQQSKVNIDSQYQKERSDAQVQYLEITSELKQSETRLTTEIAQLNKQIRDAKSVKDTCPTCGRKFDDVFIPDTTEQETQVNVLTTELNDIRESLHTESCEYNAYVSRSNTLQNDATSEYVKVISEARAHVSNFESAIVKTQQDIQCEQRSLARYEQARSTYDTTVKMLQDNITDSRNKIVELNESLVYNNDKKEDILNRLSIISKFITMTTRDFRGYLLKHVIQFIDSKSKEYCEDVFETRNIDFVLDGNNIDIRYCGKQYEACSGGEKQKVDLIVQFAIRDMLCQFLDFSSSIIVLDEIFDNLDTIGCEKVINLISKKLSDIQSIFIVTHHSDLQIPEDSRITVIKQHDGVSLVK